MRNRFNSILFILVVTTFLSCAKEEEPLFKGFEDIDMAQVGWPAEDFPIKLKVANDIDNSTVIRIEEEMTKWEESCDVDFFDNIETTTSKHFTDLKDYYFKDKENCGIYFSSAPFKEMDKTYLAVTQIYIERNDTTDTRFKYKIVHADIIVNTGVNNFTNDELEMDAYFLPRVILHELGHVLGLKHDNQGIMVPASSLANRDSQLTDYDIKHIRDKYVQTVNKVNHIVQAEVLDEKILRFVSYTKLKTN